jgi:hypothetical protein
MRILFAKRTIRIEIMVRAILRALRSMRQQTNPPHIHVDVGSSSNIRSPIFIYIYLLNGRIHHSLHDDLVTQLTSNNTQIFLSPTSLFVQVNNVV